MSAVRSWAIRLFRNWSIWINRFGHEGLLCPEKSNQAYLLLFYFFLFWKSKWRLYKDIDMSKIVPKVTCQSLQDNPAIVQKPIPLPRREICSYRQGLAAIVSFDFICRQSVAAVIFLSGLEALLLLFVLMFSRWVSRHSCETLRELLPNFRKTIAVTPV